MRDELSDVLVAPPYIVSIGGSFVSVPRKVVCGIFEVSVKVSELALVLVRKGSDLIVSRKVGLVMTKVNEVVSDGVLKGSIGVGKGHEPHMV